MTPRDEDDLHAAESAAGELHEKAHDAEPEGADGHGPNPGRDQRLADGFRLRGERHG